MRLYPINDNENEAENEKQITDTDINRPRLKYGHKYTSHYNDGYTY